MPLTCCIAPDDGRSSPVFEKEMSTASSQEFAKPTQDESTSVENHSSSDSESPVQVKEGTMLFSAIESEKWENAIMFLENGSSSGWGENTFSMIGWGGEQVPPDPKAQVRTWVVGNDWWGNIVSKRLPIHTAIIKQAPIALIQKLLEIYPDSIHCRDLDGNLPLHLSFRHSSPDSVVAFLLKSYPEATGEKNNDGKQPVDYASADACEIIQLCVDQTNKVAKKEEEKLNQALESEKTRLTKILYQLQEIRSELDHLRKAKTSTAQPEQKSKPSTGKPPSGKSTAKPPSVPIEEKLEDNQTSPESGSALKKQRSLTKLRLPWKKKKVGPA